MKKFVSSLMLSLSVLSVNALELDSEHSRLNFVSVKNDSVAEVLAFDQLSGSLSASGDAQITVPLTSVNTGIEIRDERLRKYLFKTEQFATAVYTAKVDMAALSALAVGQQQAMTLSGELALSGVTGKVDFDVLVSKTAEGSYSAVTLEPGFVNIRHFGLIDGVGKLRSLAGLNSIALVVPVTFSVVFK